MGVHSYAIILSLVALAFITLLSEAISVSSLDDAVRAAAAGVAKVGDAGVDAAVGVAKVGDAGVDAAGVAKLGNEVITPGFASDVAETVGKPRWGSLDATYIPEGFTLKPAAPAGTADLVKPRVTRMFNDEQVTVIANSQLSKERAAEFKVTICLLKNTATTLAMDVGKAAYNKAVQAAGLEEAFEMSLCSADPACMACNRLSGQISCDGGSMITSMSAAKVCRQVLKLAKEPCLLGNSCLADCVLGNICSSKVAPIDQMPMTASSNGTVQLFGFEGMDQLVGASPSSSSLGTSNVASAPTGSQRSSSNATRFKGPEQMMIMFVLGVVCLFFFTNGLV